MLSTKQMNLVMPPFSTPKGLKCDAKMSHWTLFFTKKGQPVTSFLVSSEIYFIFSLVTVSGGVVAPWLLRSGSSGPDLSPDWGHCVVSLGKTLYSHSASLHPGGVSHLSFATYHYNEKLFSMFAPTDYGWFVKTGWLILQVIAILFRI